MSMPPSHESDRPDVVQRAADAGIKAIAASLEAEGARAEHIFITLDAEGVPEGELEACTAGEGFDDAQDLAGHLLGTALSVCDQIGIDLHIAPLPHRGQG